MPQFNENFSGMIRIPLFNKTKSFGGTFVNKINKTKLYNGIITIAPINVISINVGVDVQGNKTVSGFTSVPLFDTTKNYPSTVNILAQRVNNYEGSVFVKLDKELVYSGTFYMNPSNRVQISGSIDVTNIIKFPGTFKNITSGDLKFPGLVFIEPNNHLEGKILIKGMDKRNYPGLVKIAPIRDLIYQGLTSVPLFEDSVQYSGTFTNAKEYLNLYKGKLTIPPQNFMDGKVLIKGMGMPKYPGIFVNRAWRVPQFPAQVTISRYDQEINYPGLVTNKLYKDKLFKGKVSITPQNVMEGTIEITDTPINRYYGVIVKDTNTVVNQPDNNYGTERDIHFGNGITTLAQWRFNQNKDIFYRPNQEIGAMFRMYLKRALLEDSPIRIYAINTTWNEYTVTENTKPQMTLLYTGIVKRNTIGVMDFDLGNLLAGYNKQSVFDVALAIQIDTASGTINNSRETLVNPLGLYYDYHYVPPTMRTRLHPGVVTIRLDKEKQFKGKVKILSDNAEDRFKGIVHIKGTEVDKAYPGYFFLNAPKNRSPVIPGIVKVPKFDRDIKFPGTFINRIDRDLTYPGFTSVPIFENTLNYSGSLIILSKNNEIFYPGLVTNRLDKELNIPGTVTNRLDKELKFEGLINIPLYNNINSYNGIVNIPLRYFKDFKGFTSVPLFENALNYPGDVSIPPYHFRIRKGTIKIKQFSGLKRFRGRLKISTYFKAFKGIVKISKFDKQDNYPGEVNISLRYFENFKGFTSVPLFENTLNYSGDVTIPIRYFKVRKGRVRIKRLSGNIRFNGTFNLPLRKFKRFKGIIKIAKINKQNNYPGTITIRLDKETKFKGLVNVPKYDVDVNIPSFVHILETHFHTAKGIVTIPVFDDNEVIYKGIFVNKIAEEVRYQGLVRVKSDRKKVRIFIM